MVERKGDDKSGTGVRVWVRRVQVREGGEFAKASVGGRARVLSTYPELRTETKDSVSATFIMKRTKNICELYRL
jgi:hypothetical protein